MEKKKLKKLELNKAGIVELSDNEANMIRGGGHWDPEMGWVLDTITVYGEDMSGDSFSDCTTCGRQISSGPGIDEEGRWGYIIGVRIAHELYH